MGGAIGRTVTTLADRHHSKLDLYEQRVNRSTMVEAPLAG